MEISSEHDYNPGDEDIDIDIDLRGTSVDEDHIIEDVMSNVGFDIDRNQRLSPPTSHDDLMVDDDNESTHMEDADTTDVGYIEIAQETPSHSMEDRAQAMSFDVVEDINIEYEEEDTDVQFLQETEETSWSYQEVLPENSNNLDEKLVEYEEAVEHDNEIQVQLHEDDAEIDVATADLPQDVESNNGKDEDLNAILPRVASSVTSPEKPSPEHESSVKASSETPHSPGKVLPGVGVDDVGADETDDNVVDNEHDEVEIKIDNDKRDDLYKTHDVKVIYQDVEYDLFSTSGSDDPESYFLSDLSVGKLPLSGFFAAIRDIIHEDISEDELLFITLEDLGLDFQEVSRIKASGLYLTLTTVEQESLNIQSITLNSIVELHQLLQKNDGVDDIQPLFILLDKRINSSHRLAQIAARAAEGTGLAELTMWDDGSEHLELSADDVDLHQEDQEAIQEEDDSHDEQQIAQDLTQETAKEAEKKAEEKEGLKSFAFNHPIDTEKFNLNENPAQESHKSLENSPAEVTKVPETVVEIKSSSNVQDPSVNEASVTVHDDEEYNEGEDLIDYSDDETEPLEPNQAVALNLNEFATDESRTSNGTFTYFISPCYKPQTCFCYECNLLILAELETKNEELRRSSLSRTKESDDVDGTTNYSEVLHTNTGQIAVSLEDGVNDKYDKLPKENSGLVSAVVQHEDTTNSGEAYPAVESKDDGNGLSTDGGLTVSHPHSEFPEELDLGGDQVEGSENIQEYFDAELDLDDDREHDQTNLGSSDDFSGIDSHQIGATEDSHSSPKVVDETVGHGDLVDTESAGSENTLVAQSELEPEDLGDEIGYDDDEEDAVAIHKVVSQTSASLPLVTAVPSKRARSDASFEDSMESNGTYLLNPYKRPNTNRLS